MAQRQPARIPLHEDIFVLSRIFHEAGFQLVVVGGAVRDFLLSKGKLYIPKDVDLATNALPDQVASVLQAAKIKNRAQGESFGVWIARIQDREYEIATFREDGEYSDGRRPDDVSFCDAEADYKRRDLTINGLFYEIPVSANEDGEIIDYGNGQGFDDILERRVRTIGSPMDRFQEDRLRVLRAVRFHARFHEAPANEVFDADMLHAIDHFKALGGVSAPRIHQEFMAGIGKAMHVPNLLRSYNALRLFPAIFPGLEVDVSLLDKVHVHLRNPVVLLACLFRREFPNVVREALNAASWPNEVVDEVKFLLDVYDADVEELVPLAVKLNDQRRANVFAFAPIIEGCDKLKDRRIYEYLGDCEIPKYSGEYIEQEFGIAPGPEMGKKQRELQKMAFLGGLEKF